MIVSRQEAGVIASAQDLLSIYSMRVFARDPICWRNLESTPSIPGAVCGGRAFRVASSSRKVISEEFGDVFWVYFL